MNGDPTEVMFYHIGNDDSNDDSEYTVMLGKENIWEIQKFQGGMDALKVIDVVELGWIKNLPKSMGNLPKLVSFGKKKHYLACTTEGNRQGCIALFSDVAALNKTHNFVVLPAKEGFVHLKSSYNNKYLRRLLIFILNDLYIFFCFSLFHNVIYIVIYVIFTGNLKRVDWLLHQRVNQWTIS